MLYLNGFVRNRLVFFVCCHQKNASMKIVGCDVGIKHLGLCMIDTETNKIEQWHVLDVLGDKNATKTSIEECVKYMLIALEKLSWWGTLSEDDLVAIESQPVGRMATGNIKCKCISHAIQSFVQLKTTARSMFVNPKTKVSAEIIASIGGIVGGGDDNVKKRYKIHKQAAVATVQTMINNDAQWAEWYNGLKKKDDAADAYLLAVVAQKSKKSKKRKR